jgi:hypothetical protein
MVVKIYHEGTQVSDVWQAFAGCRRQADGAACPGRDIAAGRKEAGREEVAAIQLDQADKVLKPIKKFVSSGL